MHRPKTTRWIAHCLGLAAALLLVLPAAAQDLSGAWDMETTALLPGAEEPCVFSGACEMQEAESELTGTVELMLISGPEGCPAEMLADLSGFVDGDEVGGVLMGGQLGEATFAGERTASFTGDFTAEDGPYAGSTGSWFAVRPPDLPVTAIPTATGLGLALLVLALLGAGLWVMRSPLPS
jgi:hypothetical protein